MFRHAGDLFLLVLGAPLIAMMTLAYEAAGAESATLEYGRLWPLRFRPPSG